ncbi:MAG: hypothetical protein AAB250_11815, partial [Bdellovibrionota bacterium]
VYDIRTNPKTPVYPEHHGSCLSTVGGMNAEIVYGGVVALTHGEPFPGETAVDLKAFSAYMGVHPDWDSSPLPPRPPEIQRPMGQTSWTRDVDQKSYGAMFTPNVFMMCRSGESSPMPNPVPSPVVTLENEPATECTASLPEYFSAFVEIQDEP